MKRKASIIMMALVMISVTAMANEVPFIKAASVYAKAIKEGYAYDSDKNHGAIISLKTCRMTRNISPPATNSEKCLP